jgi:hypothetical protein
VPFGRALCQQAWEIWYEKQWEKKSVQERILQASNLIAQDAYNIVYAWDRIRGFDLVAAGFKELNLSQLQEMLNLAAAKAEDAQVQLPPEVLQRWDQASSLINTITAGEFEGWFNALSQAIEQGQFEEEYDRLLSLGLQRLEQALLILMDSQDQQRAKELIYKGAQVWARLAQISEEVSDEIQQRMDEVRNRLMSNFILIQAACDLVPGVCTILQVVGVETAFDLVDLLIHNWDMAIRVLHNAGFSDQELSDFSLAIQVIVSDYVPEYFEFATNILTKITYTSELARFLDWMTSPYEQEREVQDTLEQGFGTILVAGNSILQGGWEYKGLKLDQEGSYTQEGFGDWWGAVLLLPREQNPEGRSIIAVTRGDNCVDCAVKASEISSWIGRAVELAPSVQRDHNADIGVVTFAFTNPNAVVASVLERLRQDHRNSTVPIIVSWWENGQVRYECIGLGCSNLSWQEQERIACNQLGLPAGCTGPPQESQITNTSPGSNSDPLAVGSPPPPEPSYCSGICIL